MFWDVWGQSFLIRSLDSHCLRLQWQVSKKTSREIKYIEVSVWMAPCEHVTARSSEALMTAAFHEGEILRASLFWRFLGHRIEISCCWFYSFRFTCFDKTRLMLCKHITQNWGCICFPGCDGNTEQLRWLKTHGDWSKNLTQLKTRRFSDLCLYQF